MSPSPRKDSRANHSKHERASENAIKQVLKSTKANANSLTYKESLNELELLILALQDESIAVEKIHINYLKAKVYLERCESLLKIAEQTVLEMNLEDLEVNDS